MALNQIVLMGRMTKDPELRTTKNGKSMLSFTLAVDRDVLVDGKRLVDFIDCTVWGGKADFIAKYFGKGSAMIVSGRLEIRAWQSEDGRKHRKSEVKIEDAYFSGQRKDISTEGESDADALEIPESDDSEDGGSVPF